MVKAVVSLKNAWSCTTTPLHVFVAYTRTVLLLRRFRLLPYCIDQTQAKPSTGESFERKMRRKKVYCLIGFMFLWPLLWVAHWSGLYFDISCNLTLLVWGRPSSPYRCMKCAARSADDGDLYARKWTETAECFRFFFFCCKLQIMFVNYNEVLLYAVCAGSGGL